MSPSQPIDMINGVSNLDMRKFEPFLMEDVDQEGIVCRPVFYFSRRFSFCYSVFVDFYHSHIRKQLSFKAQMKPKLSLSRSKEPFRWQEKTTVTLFFISLLRYFCLICKWDDLRRYYVDTIYLPNWKNKLYLQNYSTKSLETLDIRVLVAQW